MIYRGIPFPTPTIPIAHKTEPPLLKRSVDPRPITAEELELFQDPKNLHAKQFILSPEMPDESSMYEVTSYRKKRDKTVQFEVLFDDIPDPIRVDSMEKMMNMLKDSLYLPA